MKHNHFACQLNKKFIINPTQDTDNTRICCYGCHYTANVALYWHNTFKATSRAHALCTHYIENDWRQMVKDNERFKLYITKTMEVLLPSWKSVPPRLSIALDDTSHSPSGWMGYRIRRNIVHKLLDSPKIQNWLTQNPANLFLFLISSMKPLQSFLFMTRLIFLSILCFLNFLTTSTSPQINHILTLATKKTFIQPLFFQSITQHLPCLPCVHHILSITDTHNPMPAQKHDCPTPSCLQHPQPCITLTTFQLTPYLPPLSPWPIFASKVVVIEESCHTQCSF